MSRLRHIHKGRRGWRNWCDWLAVFRSYFNFLWEQRLENRTRTIVEIIKKKNPSCLCNGSVTTPFVSFCLKCVLFFPVSDCHGFLFSSFLVSLFFSCFPCIGDCHSFLVFCFLVQFMFFSVCKVFVVPFFIYLFLFLCLCIGNRRPWYFFLYFSCFPLFLCSLIFFFHFFVYLFFSYFILHSRSAFFYLPNLPYHVLRLILFFYPHDCSVVFLCYSFYICSHIKKK